MTDQEVKEKLTPKQEPNVIFEVKTFADKRGFEVKELNKQYQDSGTGILGTWDKTTKNDTEYYGSVVLNIETGNPQRPVVQHPIQFKFPNEVDCITKAFDSFETEIEKEVSRQKAEAEKQRIAMAGSKKDIIIPNTMKFQPKE